MAEGEDRTGDIVSLQDLIRLAMLDVAPTLQPSLRAMEPVQQAIVLQCVYYAHMFFVLREQAIKRRIKLEEQKKKSLSGTFEGAEERQDAYLKRREAMVAQFGLDNAGEAETQQVAQADALITELEETLAKKGADVRLGIIGGGRIGTALLRMLLHCGTFSPDRIRVSTRRPEMLLDYQAQGVKCDYDNAMVVARSEVIFLCCLPAHLPRVAQDIAAGGGLRPQLLVVSAIAGTTAEKIQNMLKVRERAHLATRTGSPVVSAHLPADLNGAGVWCWCLGVAQISCVLRPIVNTPIITMQIEAAFQGQYGVSDPADMARSDAYQPPRSLGDAGWLRTVAGQWQWE
jgi:hypothetical protein